MHWLNGSGIISLQITKAEAAQGAHSGSCDADILELSNRPRIRRQLNKIDREVLKRELDQWGAWDDVELADHEQNLQRVLWIACGDIVEGNC
jgi:hypothetical protein